MTQSRLSRRKVASIVADELIAKRDVLPKLAAYLVENNQLRESALYVRDIESALAERGVVLADVTGSHNLTEETKQNITDYLKKTVGANEVHLRTNVDPDLLGGVRIETPDKRLDATLRNRINQLIASKI